jgi:hypothetical protein
VNHGAVLRGKLGKKVDVKMHLFYVLVGPEAKALSHTGDIRLPRKQERLVARLQLSDFEFCQAAINLY